MPLVDSNPPLTVPISLDQLEMGMVPLHSVQIEEIEADGTATKVMCRLYSHSLEYSGTNLNQTFKELKQKYILVHQCL